MLLATATPCQTPSLSGSLTNKEAQAMEDRGEICVGDAQREEQQGVGNGLDRG